MTTKLILREIQQDLRILIADASKSRAMLKRERLWSEMATNEAFINGLELALDVVKRVAKREKEQA